MKTKYHTNRWLRTLYIVGMMIAPISLSLPFFFGTIYNYQTASSNGNSTIYQPYTGTIVLFFGTIVILISLGFFFGKGLKSYVNHQVTRDDVIVLRMFYFAFILASLIVDFMIFSYFLLSIYLFYFIRKIIYFSLSFFYCLIV